MYLHHINMYLQYVICRDIDMRFSHPAAIALLKKILKPNPAKRYTIEKIKSHLWCRKYATEYVP